MEDLTSLGADAQAADKQKLESVFNIHGTEMKCKFYAGRFPPCCEQSSHYRKHQRIAAKRGESGGRVIGATIRENYTYLHEDKIDEYYLSRG